MLNHRTTIFLFSFHRSIWQKSTRVRQRFNDDFAVQKVRDTSCEWITADTNRVSRFVWSKSWRTYRLDPKEHGNGYRWHNSDSNDRAFLSRNTSIDDKFCIFFFDIVTRLTHGTIFAVEATIGEKRKRKLIRIDEDRILMQLHRGRAFLSNILSCMFANRHRYACISTVEKYDAPNAEHVPIFTLFLVRCFCIHRFRQGKETGKAILTRGEKGWFVCGSLINSLNDYCYTYSTLHDVIQQFWIKILTLVERALNNCRDILSNTMNLF